jgi:lipopolysaccharide export system protein LptA
MDRRRLLQFAFTTVFVLFLLLLLSKFRPKFDAPAPVEPEQVRRTAEGTLSARGFTYRQETAGKVEFTATASAVTESAGELKLLTDPVITMASGARAWGKKGSFDQTEGTLRIWEDAHLAQPDGWIATSTGFRLTPEGEIVSESHADLVRGDIMGGADLLRYHRQTLLAHLEGSVHFEQGPRSMTCTAVDLDLSKHGGTMAGPVVLVAEQGALKAPAGTIVLDEQNRLRSVTLGSPALGDGSRFSCTGRSVSADFDAHGQISQVHLVGEASVTSKAEPAAALSSPPSPASFTAKSDRFDLTPKPEDLWAWTAPGALTVEREGGISHATSGRGTMGGKAPETADLAGPVSGNDRRGDFKGDRATMVGGDWTLAGHAEVAQPGERLTADRITFRKDGASEAEGSVRGWRKGKRADEAETTYAGDRVKSAAGGYPAKLVGHAVVTKGGMALSAPSIKISDESSALAEGGATATFMREGQGSSAGTSTVSAPVIRYAGKDHRATAEGSSQERAKGQGKDYSVTGDLLRAVLDDKEKPVRYEAEGKAAFTGTLYDGTGDFLSYDPETQAGQARGKDRAAVVIQKNPYRRVSGPVVDFAPKRIEVLPVAGSPRRGAIEGVNPAGKIEPESRRAGEPGKEKKSADGTKK